MKRRNFGALQHIGAPEGAAVVADVRSALGFLLAAAIRDVGYFVDCGCTPPGDVETRVAAIRAHLSGHRLAASLIDLSSSLGPEPDLQAATIAGLEVKRWAEDSGKLTTARIFAQGHLLIGVCYRP